jgi:hypothetical protein
VSSAFPYLGLLSHAQLDKDFTIVVYHNTQACQYRHYLIRAPSQSAAITRKRSEVLLLDCLIRDVLIFEGTRYPLKLSHPFGSGGDGHLPA